MKKNPGVASYLILLTVIIALAGCEHPSEPSSQPKDIYMSVDGDLPIYVEYSYEDALYGRQEAKTAIPTTSKGWEVTGWAKGNSAFRFYARSMMSHGRVRAYVLVFATANQTTVLNRSAESDSGSVEIIGTVP